MKGIYTKKAIMNLVEPLKAISSVYSSTVPIVYENDSETIFIGSIDENKSIFTFYNLKAKEIIQNYENPIKDIGINDVKQFIHILHKYCNNIYTDDVTIEPIDNRLVITCGNETVEYYLTELTMIEQYRSKVKRLKTELLTKACEFELSGSNLKKFIMNLGLFDGDDEEVNLSSNMKTNNITVKIHSSMSANQNKVSMNITDIGEIKAAFNVKFMKKVFEGLLGCNDKFNVIVYTGDKTILEVSYEKEFYNMKFYLIPLEK